MCSAVEAAQDFFETLEAGTLLLTFANEAIITRITRGGQRKARRQQQGEEQLQKKRRAGNHCIVRADM